MCCRLPGGDVAAFHRTLEMVELWLAHLRGPGRFAGRVVLLTNEPRLPLRDVELVPLGATPADRRQLFLQRVLAWDRLAVRRGEWWMQLDADTLVVRPLEALFPATDEATLWASPSGLTPLDPMHAASLLSRPQRLWYGRVRGWRRRLGVSACITTCAGAHWAALMGAWAGAIHAHGDRPVPELGDQSFLNLLHMTGAIRVRALPPALVHHVRTEADLGAAAAERAHVLHFPNPHKLAMMKQRSVA